MKKIISILLVSAAGMLFVQSEELVSGPPSGTPAAPVVSYALHGPHAGKEFDAAADIGNRPGALLFIHEMSRNIVPVLRGLDDLASEFSILGFRSHTLVLSDDRTSAENRLKAINGSLKLDNPIILSLDGLEGPGNYALNRRATLSVIFLKDGKVRQSLALVDAGFHDVTKIREQIETVAGTIPSDPAALDDAIAADLPKDVAALRRLALTQGVQLQKLRSRLRRLEEVGGSYMAKGRNRRMQTNRSQRSASATTRQPTRPRVADSSAPSRREGPPPTDARLESHLRSFIRKTQTDEQLDGIYADIVARAGESDELRAQSREMFKLVLSLRDRYGTPHAHKLARQFLDRESKAEPKRGGR